MYTRVTGISNSDEVVGGYTDKAGQTHGFSYAGGKFTAINVTGAAETFAFGISYRTGEIVGSYKVASGAVYGFCSTRKVLQPSSALRLQRTRT